MFIETPVAGGDLPGCHREGSKENSQPPTSRAVSEFHEAQLKKRTDVQTDREPRSHRARRGHPPAGWGTGRALR